MGTVTLVKWGNSIGIRIPAAIMKEAHLKPGGELQIFINKKNEITLTPIQDPQKGWKEAFNAAAGKKDKELFLDDIQNQFDEDEWKW